MKRITTAAVAAATALSLATVPAFAQENDDQGSSQQNEGSSSADGDKKKSSEIDDQEAINYAKKNKSDANSTVKNALDKEGEEQEKALKPLISSLKSDAAQGWAPGKTFEILLGTGITAAILGLLAFAAQSGFLAGLPF